MTRAEVPGVHAAVAEGSVDVVAAAAPETAVVAPPRDHLSDPATAHPRRRPMFSPKRGWFRRLERGVSHWLSRRVYPWVPGIDLPYGQILKHGLRLSEAEIELPDLPAPFHGTRLLLISDTHSGPFVSPGALSDALARLQALAPDLIVLAGDLTSSQPCELEQTRDAYRQLRAPLGVYATLGNHDHYSGEPERLREIIEGLGIEVLHNRAVQIEREGASLSLAGVDDLLLGEPDLDAALRGTVAPVILVSHNPDLFFEAARRGVSLVLSGHTHAGQIRMPGLPVLARQSRYRLDEGRYRVGDSELVVSRGLGAVGLPLRLWCPPEAVLLTLRRASGSAGTGVHEATGS